MTWLDVVLIVVVLIFVALGARLGSLWTGACIVGGFLGAALVDTYALPLSGLMGNFHGAVLLAAVLLYLAGVGSMLIPGAVISQIGSVFILNIIDGGFGLFTGFFTAIMIISLALLAAVPLVPGFESKPAFKRSVLARPLHRSLEEIFSHTPLRAVFTHQKIKIEAVENLVPVAKEAEEQIKKLKP